MTPAANAHPAPANTAADPAGREAQLGYVAEHLLSRAAILVRLLVKQVRSKEISRTEMQVLGILRDGPRSISELTELEGTAQPTMTLLVRRLQERGWVRRERVPDDGRVAMIRLTGAGDSAFAGFREQFLAAMRGDLQGLSDAQLQELADATASLGAFVEELQRRTRV
jgi:DNA-binding MarR family transcriptional regulator